MTCLYTDLATNKVHNAKEMETSLLYFANVQHDVAVASWDVDKFWITRLYNRLLGSYAPL